MKEVKACLTIEGVYFIDEATGAYIAQIQLYDMNRYKIGYRQLCGRCGAGNRHFTVYVGEHNSRNGKYCYGCIEALNDYEVVQ